MKKLLIKYFSNFLSLIGVKTGSKTLPRFLLLLNFSLYPLSLLAPPKVSASELDRKDRVFRTPRPYELLRKIIQTKAEYCVSYLKEAKSAIQAARGSLHILQAPPEAFSPIKPKKDSPLKKFSPSHIEKNESWEEANLLWQVLEDKIRYITSELSPQLDLGLTEAAIALHLLYGATIRFVYKLLENNGTPEPLVEAARNFIKELEGRVVPHIEKSKVTFPGCFICPNADLKEALLLCQKELLLWNKEGLALTPEIVNPYLFILDAKHKYLYWGIKGEKMPQDVAQEQINLLIEATKVLAETRLQLTGHHH